MYYDYGEQDIQLFQKICLNGHQIETHYEEENDPIPTEFCEDCGSKIISTCQNCHEPILGAYQSAGIIGFSRPNVPNYCKFCGEPYNWTQSIIESTEELMTLDESLTEKDLQIVQSSVPDLLVDTPKTKVAATKFGMVLNKSTQVIKDASRELLVDVISETAKKIIFPN